jgi:hypothetical protein
MKSNRIQWIMILCLFGFLLGACRSISLEISKRKYRPGYHVDFSGGKAGVKSQKQTRSVAVALQEMKTDAIPDSVTAQKIKTEPPIKVPPAKDNRNPGSNPNTVDYPLGISDAGPGEKEITGKKAPDNGEIAGQKNRKDNTTVWAIAIGLVVSVVLIVVVVNEAKKEAEKETEKCCIAATAYNDNKAPELYALREYRDKYLASTFMGRQMIKAYYAASPVAAGILSKSDTAKRWIRRYLLKPVVSHICLKYSIELKKNNASPGDLNSQPTA